MKIVMLHNGSVLGKQIMDTWCNRYSQADEIQVLDNCSLDDVEKYQPNLVILASDGVSEFERLVLAKCRDFKFSILTILGRGSTVLLGPLETPGVPGCVTCLQLRFENTFDRSLINSILLELDDSIFASLPTSLEISQAELSTLSQIVVDEMYSLTSTFSNPPSCKGKVGVYEPGNQDIEWVPVIPSHDCPRCKLVPADNPVLAQVQFTSHTMNDPYTLRVGPVDFKRLEELFVHTKVGYISALNELWSGDRFVLADAHIYTPAGDDIAGYGSGLSSSDAKQSAVLEVLERSCGFRAVNRRPVVFDKYSELSDAAVHPSLFGLQNQGLLVSLNHPNLEPFDEEKRYSWVWAHSTKYEKPVLVPEQIAYYGPTADEKRFITETSNGCAIGGTVEEAVLHGIFEVLERDGFLNMWYAKLPVPELKLGHDGPPTTLEAMYALEKNGFQVRLFNLSHDLDIPIICAVGINQRNDYPKVVSGSACHLNPYRAVDSALRELTVQVAGLQRAGEERREEAASMLLDSKKIKNIVHHSAVAALPEAYPRWEFLLTQESGGQLQSLGAAFADATARYQIDSQDIRMILGSILNDLHERGFDVIVLNQTSVEVSCAGLDAVKVLIPGMTPITFGYGFERVWGLRRIFELPYQLGYSSGVLTEKDLNQDCHPLS